MKGPGSGGFHLNNIGDGAKEAVLYKRMPSGRRPNHGGSWRSWSSHEKHLPKDERGRENQSAWRIIGGGTNGTGFPGSFCSSLDPLLRSSLDLSGREPPDWIAWCNFWWTFTKMTCVRNSMTSLCR